MGAQSRHEACPVTGLAALAVVAALFLILRPLTGQPGTLAAPTAAPPATPTPAPFTTPTALPAGVNIAPLPVPTAWAFEGRLGGPLVTARSSAFAYALHLCNGDVLPVYERTLNELRPLVGQEVRGVAGASGASLAPWLPDGPTVLQASPAPGVCPTPTPLPPGQPTLLPTGTPFTLTGHVTTRLNTSEGSFTYHLTQCDGSDLLLTERTPGQLRSYVGQDVYLILATEWGQPAGADRPLPAYVPLFVQPGPPCTAAVPAPIPLTQTPETGGPLPPPTALPPATEAPQPPPTATPLFAVAAVYDLLSPDGQWTAGVHVGSPVVGGANAGRTPVQLRLRRTDGGQVWTVVDDFQRSNGWLSPAPQHWTRDGRFLYYAFGFEVHRVELATGQTQPVALDVARVVRVSPDETRLAYIDWKMRLTVRELWAEGVEQMVVPDLGDAAHVYDLVWAPDSRAVAFSYPTADGRQSLIRVNLAPLKLYWQAHRTGPALTLTGWPEADQITAKDDQGKAYRVNAETGQVAPVE